MWSLGVIFYQFVSSWKKPFPSKNLKILLNSISNDKPAPLPSSTPAFIKEIIEMLLIKNPEYRPNTVQLMQN